LETATRRDEPQDEQSEACPPKRSTYDAAVMSVAQRKSAFAHRYASVPLSLNIHSEISEVSLGTFRHV
jgi:hypothetical protein